jgi:hypothetical protein
MHPKKGQQMQRREFIHYTTAIATLAQTPLAFSAAPAPKIAFTFDDPTTKDGATKTIPTKIRRWML